MAFKRDKLVEVKETPRAACAFDGCIDPALSRVSVPTGWANLCPFHYDVHFARVARDATQQMGLKSLQQVRAFAMANRKDAPNRGSRDWATDILARHRRGDLLSSGHPITPLHVRLATEATRGRTVDRTPGEDDEAVAA
jgi:hypothetical protein